MQPSQLPQSVFKPVPPPLWYVTNGETTVGPVMTDLLMRGFEHGRIPEYCHVAALRGSWRKLEGVREIAALTSKVTAVVKTPNLQTLTELERPIERIKDEEELCHNITRLSVIVTGAESAMLHYLGRAQRTLTTRCVLGPMSGERMGHELAEDDRVLKAARSGKPVMGPPYGSAEDALAIRFASSRNGVGGAAMIPVFIGGRLTAMLELARPGHAFRRRDLQRAERIVQRSLLLRAN